MGMGGEGRGGQERWAGLKKGRQYESCFPSHREPFIRDLVEVLSSKASAEEHGDAGWVLEKPEARVATHSSICSVSARVV